MYVLGENLKPGHVIEQDGDFALVTYVGDCDTLPSRERGYEGPEPAEDFVEPFLVYLKHQRDDRWLQSSEVTYVLYKRTERVQIYPEIRVQYPARIGVFYSGDELLEAVPRIIKEEQEKNAQH